MWFIYAALGAVFKSLGHLNRKQLAHTSSLFFTFFSCAVGTLILLPVVIVWSLPVVPLLMQHFLICVALALTSSIGLFFNMKALSREQLSFVAPLNGFIPVFGLLTGWVFLSEVPTLLGFIGVGIIVAGAYVIGFDQKIVNWYEPLRRIFVSKAGQFAIANAVAYALNTVVIKVALNLNFDAFSILFVTSLLTTIGLLPLLLQSSHRASLRDLHKHPKLVLFASINSLLGSIFHYFATAATYIGYALAVRRFDAIISVLLGWRILKESNIRFKLIGASLITIGAVVLTIA